jgi:hypothetical protein
MHADNTVSQKSIKTIQASWLTPVFLTREARDEEASGDGKNLSSRPARAKSCKTHLNQWLGTVIHACYPSYMRKHK